MEKVGRNMSTPESRALTAEILDAWPKLQGDERHRAVARWAAQTRANMTLEEASAEARRRWGPDAIADHYGDRDCRVGMRDGIGFRWVRGFTFEEAFVLAGPGHARPAVPSPADIRAANRQAADRIIAACPEWAYPTAWRLAVMAACEHCGERTKPRMMGASLQDITAILSVYHEDRLAGWTEAASFGHLPREVDELASVLCRAYERGRPGTGGVPRVHRGKYAELGCR
jgi:hypothetical protein